MKKYIAISISLFIFISILSGNKEDHHPAFFRSTVNIGRPNNDVKKIVTRFSELQKNIPQPMLLNPAFSKTQSRLKNGLLHLRNLIKNKDYKEAHRLIIELRWPIEIIESSTDKHYRLTNAEKNPAYFRKYFSRTFEYIDSLKPLPFTELINLNRKIISLKNKMNQAKLVDRDFQIILYMTTTYINRYSYYRDFSKAKSLLTRSRNLQHKLNSIWNLCRTMRYNPHLDNLIKSIYNQFLECEMYYKRSEFLKCIKKIEPVIRTQTIAIDKMAIVANAWKRALK